MPKNLNLVHCVDAEEWNDSNVMDSTDDLNFRYASEASFDLPLSSATLFLISRGENLGGAVRVVTSEEQADDSAKVLISLRYYEEKVRDWTKVCLLSRDEDEDGVGVFTPLWRGGRRSDRRLHTVNYQITVTLPALVSEASPLQIKHLETDLPNTAHRLEDLSNVSFDRISLRATNGPIDLEVRLTALLRYLLLTEMMVLQSLTTQSSSIATTNGHITGTLSSSLLSRLTATNGPIKVRVNLTSTEQSNATFVAHTTNGPIQADISLISTAGTGGTFHVSTTTTNSPLSVKFPTSPVGSTLHLEAKTTNSPAVVSLDSAYEGSFSLLTSRYFHPRLHVNEEVEDPSGKGRQRRVDVKEVKRGEVYGDVLWGDEPQAKGAVIVSTTNSPVSLNV
ncbi:hypothetical protein CVT25_005062 [Psilocybe cyanescens]|uniref:Uncharacterized protein n=1 Tax=Psilocybe cyanescens TaxID=93625 RepID=A0A409XDV0_PSICY|nr:hypothetical protein CVT25_005062 [Psilocybe cyanescens]